MILESFPPVVGPSPRVLILGSMPGARSLEAGRYYAHPRNRFWTVMSRLIDLDASASYVDRLASLKKAGVALWDVLKHCEREGSLDTSIVRATEVANDLAGLLQENPSIRAVAFNGKKAARSYRRFVMGEGRSATRRDPPSSIARERAIELIECPSTSPANASRSIEQLVAEWSAIHPFLSQQRHDLHR